MMSKPLKKSAGIALVTVLLVVAAATIAAVSISSRLQVDIRRTENLIRSDQAWQHMLGIESWAKGDLADMAKASPSVKDPLGEDWAIRMKDDVEGGTVEGVIIDQQGLFNLNNLVDQNGKNIQIEKARFETLLDLLDLDKQLADAVIDWLDKDSTMVGAGGAEDDYYQSLDPPYKAANRLMVHRSELLLVRGITPKIYDELSPYVTALPELNVDVNINTAPENVLLSVVAGITPADVEALLNARESVRFKNKNDINTHPALTARDASRLGFQSNYFVVKSSVNVGKARVKVISLLQRMPAPQGIAGDIKILQRMREDIF